MKWIKGVLFVFAVFLAADAWGQCTVSVSGINFGNYDSNVRTGVSNISYIFTNCSAGTQYRLQLDAGSHSGGNFHTRKMLQAGGVSTLNYNFYRDSAHTEVWGDGTSNTFIQSGTGTGNNDRYTIYGLIPGGQAPEPGSYSDSVSVVVIW